MRDLLPAGWLRHRVEIQRAELSRNALGEVVKVWTTQRTVYAEVIVEKVGFDANRNQPQAERKLKVHMRYGVDVTTENRLVHRQRVLRIDGVNNLFEGLRFLELTCTEMTDLVGSGASTLDERLDYGQGYSMNWAL